MQPPLTRALANTHTHTLMHTYQQLIPSPCLPLLSVLRYASVSASLSVSVCLCLRLFVSPCVWCIVYDVVQVLLTKYFGTHAHAHTYKHTLSLSDTHTHTHINLQVPAYSGLGTQEDSFGSVLYLVPKPPAKNVMKMLQNEKKRLRFRESCGARDMTHLYVT